MFIFHLIGNRWRVARLHGNLLLHFGLSDQVSTVSVAYVSPFTYVTANVYVACFCTAGPQTVGFF